MKQRKGHNSLAIAWQRKSSISRRLWQWAEDKRTGDRPGQPVKVRTEVCSVIVAKRHLENHQSTPAQVLPQLRRMILHIPARPRHRPKPGLLRRALVAIAFRSERRLPRYGERECAVCEVALPSLHHLFQVCYGLGVGLRVTGRRWQYGKKGRVGKGGDQVGEVSRGYVGDEPRNEFRAK